MKRRGSRAQRRAGMKTVRAQLQRRAEYRACLARRRDKSRGA